jgi:hypothetical protein
MPHLVRQLSVAGHVSLDVDAASIRSELTCEYLYDAESQSLHVRPCLHRKRSTTLVNDGMATIQCSNGVTVVENVVCIDSVAIHVADEAVHVTTTGHAPPRRLVVDGVDVTDFVRQHAHRSTACLCNIHSAAYRFELHAIDLRGAVRLDITNARACNTDCLSVHVTGHSSLAIRDERIRYASINRVRAAVVGRGQLHVPRICAMHHLSISCTDEGSVRATASRHAAIDKFASPNAHVVARRLLSR